MTTRYPADLPDVPADRWGARVVNVLTTDDGEGNLSSHVTWLVPFAEDPEQAERRVLAVQDYDYEDDLRGARAEATLQTVGWLVTIIMAPYR